TLARMTPDVIYDQMVAGGVASKLIFSWLGNPGVGSLHAIRRRIEDHDPEPLEIEEYSHFGMVCRYVAGASNLPFFPIRSYYESDIPVVNPKIVPMTSPYDDATEVYVVPPLRPDVSIVHAQRADASGDAQIWGLLGCQKEAAFAGERVIVVCEEIVEESVIRQDPNRTVIPGVVVDAVVEEPFACHPSFAQGYYDRDNAFYLEWDRIARDPATLATGATAITSMFELFAFYLQAGLIDVAFLGGAQIDRFGNLNTTVIGRYETPKVRLPGSGGACEIAIHARHILVIMRQASRSFVDLLDFRTSPGHSGDPAHDAARGWHGSGPTSVR